jgi:hypothetical protein
MDLKSKEFIQRTILLIARFQKQLHSERIKAGLQAHNLHNSSISISPHKDEQSQ